ncbi:hypothetical protein C8J45_105297 [Sphingomonas sp. PP-CE-3G-477]|uniref:hypothetical protein n=1 Tax=Sphingomonas sp. PP-CE-3G-477 TaxID=2135660 RepID=UPI000D43943F|nr:hypothetical protein [Sphingomonas sp. PP-CE-3G-477]PTQ63720.1 hypothetical protein C8J45_105297 [Sphingomonas sp. PP-CE-3G-477]
MKKVPRKNLLRRYGTIGSAIDVLYKRRLAFLDPRKWDDKNDSEFMRLYKKKSECSNLRALCCTESPETYHHWKVFTDSADGCFIDFHKRPLLDAVIEQPKYRYRAMDYISLDEIKISDYNHRDLPFLKRSGFKPEKEFRIIYEGACPDNEAHYLPIDPEWISRIVLNPWLPPAVSESVIHTLKLISPVSDLTVTPSRLTNSKTWAQWGKRLYQTDP